MIARAELHSAFLDRAGWHSWAWDTIFDLLSMPSVSSEEDQVRRCAERLGQIARECGLECRLLETGGNPVVFGELPVNSALPTLLLYGHYDVQPPEPLTDWESPPFDPEIRGDRLYGRGTADDKGQVLACLMAIRAVVDLGLQPSVNVKVLFEGEEEKGSPNLQGFARGNGELLRADIGLAIDGNRHQSDKPTLIFGVRGGLWVEILLTTSEREMHVSYEGVARDAGQEMLRILSSLKGDDGLVSLSGYYDDIVPPSPLELACLEKLRFDMGVLVRESGNPAATGFDSVELYRRMMFTPTLTVTGLSAGYVGKGSKAAIPTQASAKLDIRLAPDQSPAKILRSLKEHLVAVSPDAQLNVLSMVPPSRTNMSRAVVRRFVDILGAITSADVVLIPSFGGSGPHHVFLDSLGIPFIWMPLAQADCRAHAANENLSLSSLSSAIDVVGGLITSPDMAAMDRRGPVPGH